MAAGQYLLLALLLLFTRRRGEPSVYLLIAMLLVTALQALDTLSTWSDPLRHLLLNWHPNILFLGSFSYWLLGPLLYGFVASVLYRPLRFRWLDLVRVLSAVFACVLVD